MIEDSYTGRVLSAVADAAARAGGSFIQRLSDGRVITVVVLHEDAEPPRKDGAA